MERNGLAVPPPTNGLATGVPFSSVGAAADDGEGSLVVPSPASKPPPPMPLTRLMGFMKAVAGVALPLRGMSSGLDGVPPMLGPGVAGAFSDSGWPHRIASDG